MNPSSDEMLDEKERRCTYITNTLRSLALPTDSERRISPSDNQIQIGKCAMVLIASAETSLSSNF